jgi:hypothetical protein
VDVYAMGNILYMILTYAYPWEEERTQVAQRKVIQGQRPGIPKWIEKSQNPVDQALITAIEMCWRQDATERASARQVSDHLNRQTVS